MKGKHTSVDKHLKRNILWLEELPGVKKVVLGISEACRHRYAPGQLRFKMDVEGGIKATGYSGIGVVDIFVKIDPLSERENVKEKILARFLDQ